MCLPPLSTTRGNADSAFDMATLESATATPAIARRPASSARARTILPAYRR